MELFMDGKIVIAGNPNVGKSQLFNKLGGIYSTVANYPYTTVEPTRTHLIIGGKKYELIDCPGINSFSATSQDEIATRDALIKESPSIIIQCLDATNIERSLLLTSQLIELNIPIILTLNLMDETHKRGVWIDSEKLTFLLGVPIVETIATENKGITELTERLEQVFAKDSIRNADIPYKNIIKNSIRQIRDCFPENAPSRAILILLLTGDKDIESWVEDKYGTDIFQKVKNAVHESELKTPKHLSSIITSDRRAWVKKLLEGIVKESKVSTSNVSDKIGRLTRHPVWGWPILAVVIYITYVLVGKIAGHTIVGWIDRSICYPFYAFVDHHISSDFITSFLVGEYGILSTGLGNALATALPILFMFFLILNIIEDTGYFSNLCILVSRVTKILGLSGQSILPLMLGFGCKTMATLTTKILDSKKERYIAIFLIAFAIPCAPQMGLIMGILGSLSFSAFVIVFGVLLIAEFTAGIVLNRLIKQDTPTDFIMEIPAIRFPSIKNIFTKLYFRMKWFMKEIPHLFMIGAFLLFIMDKTGVLNMIKEALTPVVVTFLSLPLDTVDAFLLCLVKHEAGAVLLIDLTEQGKLTYLQTVVSLIIITSLGPCVANLMAIIKQLKLTKALVMRVAILVASILIGGIVNWVWILGRKLVF